MYAEVRDTWSWLPGIMITGWLRPLLQTFQNSVQQLHTERAPHMPKVAQKYYTRLHVKSYEFIFICLHVCYDLYICE